MTRVLIFLLSTLTLSSCAQEKISGIKRVDAFYLLEAPGMISIDERRRQAGSLPDTAYLVYLQIKNELPTFIRSWKNGSSYSIISMEVIEAAVMVGRSRKDDKQIIISPRPAINSTV